MMPTCLSSFSARALLRRAMPISLAAVCLIAAACATHGATAGPDAAGWDAVPAILARIQAPTFPDRDFVITEFGAREGGTVKNTEAIARAIEACHAAGGGRVVIPPGRWLTGAIHLRSNVNLHVADGATVLFSTDDRDYLPNVLTRWEGVELMSYSPLIYAFEQENIAITGGGTLDGQADHDNWWFWCGATRYGWREGRGRQNPARARLFQMGEEGVPVEQRVFGEGSFLRPSFIQPYRCRNVLIEGVTINRAPMWNIHPVLCDNVTVRGVSVVTHGPNNDGCNPESSRYVLIEDCLFDTGDDCIALKSGRNADGRRLGRPVEYVVVRNCTMRDGHGGVVIGSEMSGGARHVYAEDCAMDNPNLERVLRIKTNSVRGGTVEHVYMRNVRVGQVADAVLRINFFYEEGDAGAHTPVVRNVHMENVTSRESNHGLYLRGYERSPISDVYPKNIHMNGVRRGNIIENIGEVHLDDVTLNGEPLVLPATATAAAL